MGKKSKRVRGAAAGRRSTSSSTDGANVAKNKRRIGQPDDQDADVEIADVLDEMEETRDNLRFQDPFEDEYEEEDVVSSDEGGDDDDDEKPRLNRDDSKVPPSRGETTTTRAWVPSLGLDAKNETLEIDLRAYRMHHALTAEWPSLSFDFVRDDFGGGGGGTGRTRFPHSLIAVAGTQAPPGEDNALTVMKMTDLWGTGSRRRRRRGSGADDSDDDSDSEDSDESDSDDDSDEEEGGQHRGDDPVLEHASLPHEGGVNRVRVMPDPPKSNSTSTSTTPEFLSTKRIVATWSDVGAVNLYDLTPTLVGFERSSGRFSSSNDLDGDNTAAPFFTNDGHRTEGYALDWSTVNPGHLVSGDCSGEIDLYRPTESSFSVTRAAYGPSKKERKAGERSVEDAQWSPTESTVFATGESGGVIRIYDTRRHGRPMLTTRAAPSGTDVNVIGWNRMVSNLLCSGDDDGVFACWDLRTFGGGPSGGGGKKEERGRVVDPLARFAYDRGSPITSVEWHPTDESMVLVTDENYTYVYDLSVEADDDGGAATGVKGTNTPEGIDAIPPQLLFLHCGSEHTKEAHWHPQISSCVMTTALNGFSVFIPSNL